MLTEEWRAKLSHLFRIPPRFQESMKPHTSLGVGGPADIFLQPDSKEELKLAMKFIGEQKLPLVVLGGGTNMLVSDKGLQGVVIQLGPSFSKISREETLLRVKGATKTPLLVRKALEMELSGLEFAWGIPGTVGGAVYMNAGAAGRSFSSLVESVQLVDKKGKFKFISKEKLFFEYRNSAFQGQRDVVITECLLRLKQGQREKIKEKMKFVLKKRRESQPSLPSAGSVFRNPAEAPAGLLIEKAGLKGYRIGDAQVSEVHANFIVNRGKASAAEIFQLIQVIQERVKELFNTSLELEIKILGEW